MSVKKKKNKLTDFKQETVALRYDTQNLLTTIQIRAKNFYEKVS